MVLPIRNLAFYTFTILGVAVQRQARGISLNSKPSKQSMFTAMRDVDTALNHVAITTYFTARVIEACSGLHSHDGIDALPGIKQS